MPEAEAGSDGEGSLFEPAEQEENAEESMRSGPGSLRRDRLSSLIESRRSSMAEIMGAVREDEVGDGMEEFADNDDEEGGVDASLMNGLGIEVTEERPTRRRRETLAAVHHRMSQYTEKLSAMRHVEVRMEGVSYNVPVATDNPTIATVRNQNPCYSMYRLARRIKDYMVHKRKGGEIFAPYAQTAVLTDVSLIFRPGNAYLVLGPPGCGKTTLLKAIAGRLPTSSTKTKNKPHLTGSIKFNGVSHEEEPDLVMPSIVSYVGQIDMHAPYLTVKETFSFAFKCCTGGTHFNVGLHSSAEALTVDDQSFTENLTIDGLDLAHVADTFVGNDDVRGVSGGQRRRVTIGEMMMGNNPVACADEISTGLDAAATCDIIRSIVTFTKAAKTSRIVALLQPGPETFSQFDEVIVLAEGRVIFAGPIDDVVTYFANLGYILPATMDVADFLQMLPTEDGAAFFDPAKAKDANAPTHHYTPQLFAKAFKQSKYGKDIQNDLKAAHPIPWTARKGWSSFFKKGLSSIKRQPSKMTSSNTNNGSSTHTNDVEAQTNGEEKPVFVPDEFKTRYNNTFFRSMILNFKRYIKLWTRDKGYIIGKIAENIGMASASGGILFNQASISFDTSEGWVNNPQDVEAAYELSNAVYGAFFLTLWHISQGTMINASDELDVRSINYKHIDANFYQTPAMVVGRTLSTLPQRSLEIFAFGIPLYWLLGLNPTAAAFFVYLAVIFAYTLALNVFYSILSNILPSKSTVQGVGTFFLLLMTQFGGYIVAPSAIPDWFEWIYWINPFGWAMQALLANEFQTGTKYDDVSVDGRTGGGVFLSYKGFKLGAQRIGYAFAFLIPFAIVCVFALGLVLSYVRYEGKKKATVKDENIDEELKKSVRNLAGQSLATQLPFTRVDLTFKDISYEVKASTTGETLRLLNNVNGFMKAGRMCALVGSSGAGKTTLMDVISLRKTSGTVMGEVHLNGFPQEKTPFLRCAAYVEQFDIQSPELTVRETVLFSANLRLDPSIEATADKAGKERFVDGVLDMLELTVLKDSQVGSFEAGGLTFEQRKRLAIAVEFAGSPSILFLDEPTSGLDARGALVVMRAMKRIADTGRTVCATIHQPSSAVFEMFDDILLLKAGGQVVFFGELGDESKYLIDYFETRGARPIEYGENPASWMLRAPVKERDGVLVDWAEEYKSSEQYESTLKEIQTLNESPDAGREISYDSVFATKQRERIRLVMKRINTIYLRSPAYNVTRAAIAILYAFIQGAIFLEHAYDPDNEFWTEIEVEGLIGTIFLAKIIIGVSSISMVVPVTKQIRDVFYKHRASGMLSHSSLQIACLVAEIPYICIVSILYAGVFYAMTGVFQFGRSFAAFWGFFTLNVAIYSYWGQAFMCLVKDVQTAGALQGALIGMNVFFSGFIVRPQSFQNFMKFGWWISPGHYTFEGICAHLFEDNDTLILASPNTPFYNYLVTHGDCSEGDEVCFGTFDQFITFFFGGKYSTSNTGLDIGILVLYLVAGRLLMWVALAKLNYANT